MPSGTFQMGGPGIQALNNGGVAWGTSDAYFALLSSSASPNPDTTDFWDDLVANEVTGTNWAANGQQLSGETINIDTTNNQVEMRATDISVATVTLSDGKYGVVVNRTPGTNATRHVLGWVQFDVALAPQGGTLAIDFNDTEGIWQYTY